MKTTRNFDRHTHRAGIFFALLFGLMCAGNVAGQAIPDCAPRPFRPDGGSTPLPASPQPDPVEPLPDCACSYPEGSPTSAKPCLQPGERCIQSLDRLTITRKRCTFEEGARGTRDIQGVLDRCKPRDEKRPLFLSCTTLEEGCKSKLDSAAEAEATDATKCSVCRDIMDGKPVYWCNWDQGVSAPLTADEKRPLATACTKKKEPGQDGIRFTEECEYGPFGGDEIGCHGKCEIIRQRWQNSCQDETPVKGRCEQCPDSDQTRSGTERDRESDFRAEPAM